MSEEHRYCGVTTDGRVVVRFFDLYDQYGIPLLVILVWAHDRRDRMVLGWGDFLTRAVKANWNMDRKLKEFRRDIADIFGPKYADRWLESAKQFVAKLNESS